MKSNVGLLISTVSFLVLGCSGHIIVEPISFCPNSKWGQLGPRQKKELKLKSESTTVWSPIGPVFKNKIDLREFAYERHISCQEFENGHFSIKRDALDAILSFIPFVARKKFTLYGYYRPE